MTDANDTISSYADAFAGFEASLNGGASSALHTQRRSALARLQSDGLPTARFEAWRHTNPAPLTREAFLPVDAGQLTQADIAPHIVDTDGPLLVFCDGVFDAELSRLPSLPAGVSISRLADAPDEVTAGLADHGGFATLNSAFVRDGAVVDVAAGKALDDLVQILHVSSGRPGLIVPRVFVRAADDSNLRLVESFVGKAGSSTLTAAVTEVSVGARAQVELVRLHAHGADAMHSGTLHVTEQEDSRFTAHTFVLSGALVREDVHTVLQGERIVSTLNGLSLPLADNHVDHFTTIEHAAPACSSHELYKGIVGGQARSVFRGKIHVHQIAQQTDAYQSNQNLLMSDDAEINSKPQLEIYADDVKCSHGSTTGQLDEEALFYLRARGIGLANARRVLTRAFADDLVDRVSDETLRTHIETLVAARLDEVLTNGEPA